MVQNKAFIFKAVPTGFPVPDQDLAVEASQFDLEQAPPQGGATLKVLYASFDPYQRGAMRPSHIKSYVSAYELGQPIPNAAVARVLKSDEPKFQAGDIVYGKLPIAEYVAATAEQVKGLNKIQNPYNIDLKVFLNALGMPGLTAFSSLYEIGKPKQGETIFISAASGAVGQLVGQLAKREGLKVIGSVGDDEKLEFIKTELGFDDGFNYKKENPLDALQRLAPDGLDIYYDNVGGEQLDAALKTMKPFGRIIACGMISQYNNTKPEEAYGVKNLYTVVSKRLTIRGFLVFDPDFGARYSKEHQEKVQKWIKEGSIKTKESVTKGIDNAPEGFIGMYHGKNFGKAVLEVADLKE